MDTKEEKWGWDEWETRTDIYALLILCIKQMNNENPPQGTGNSTRCSAMTQTGMKPKKVGMCV